VDIDPYRLKAFPPQVFDDRRADLPHAQDGDGRLAPEQAVLFRHPFDRLHNGKDPSLQSVHKRLPVRVMLLEVTRPLTRNGDRLRAGELPGKIEAFHDLSDQLLVAADLIDAVRHRQNKAAPQAVAGRDHPGNEGLARGDGLQEPFQPLREISLHVPLGTRVDREDTIELEESAESQQAQNRPAHRDGNETENLTGPFFLVNGDHPPFSILHAPC